MVTIVNMKRIYKCLAVICFLQILPGCAQRESVPDIYRFYAGQKNGLDVWIVDGYKVRHMIYREFLYGGNGQRYCYTPAGEIWIDHAVSCEEYELTLAHEINERHLMAKFGWTYDKSHDSSLSIELLMRRSSDSICQLHENNLHAVSPTDWSNRKEITAIDDSIRLAGIYRIPVRVQDGIAVWIVDGYLVRKNIFPDFGFSGNDLVYHFIPSKEIWIDGQISCEEMEYSIAAEILERSLMKQGKSYSDAYEASVDQVHVMRDRMESRIRNHPPVMIPDTLQRESGVIDTMEK
jgi:hypothetical protein